MRVCLVLRDWLTDSLLVYQGGNGNDTSLLTISVTYIYIFEQKCIKNLILIDKIYKLSLTITENEGNEPFFLFQGLGELNNFFFTCKIKMHSLLGKLKFFFSFRTKSRSETFPPLLPTGRVIHFFFRVKSRCNTCPLLQSIWRVVHFFSRVKSTCKQFPPLQPTGRIFFT